MQERITPALAAGDWGTTSFRLWLLAADGAVLAERRSGEGLMAVREGGFADTLEGHLSAMGAPGDLPVLLCGMVGARTGWVEAAYLDAPLALSEVARRATPVPHTGRSVAILPGVAGRDPERPDVMRGEETKLLGLGPASGLVVMPGTHSKWARLEEGRLAEFATFMTGELFAHLTQAERSVLREATASDATIPGDHPAFLDALRESLAEPALILNRLFSLRAGWLLHGRAPQENKARLSGLLIGLEAAGAKARFGSDHPVTLVAGGPAAAPYEAALKAAGFTEPHLRKADDCVLAGLTLAARERGLLAPEFRR